MCPYRVPNHELQEGKKHNRAAHFAKADKRRGGFADSGGGAEEDRSGANGEMGTREGSEEGCLIAKSCCC